MTMNEYQQTMFITFEFTVDGLDQEVKANVVAFTTMDIGDPIPYYVLL